ncbi:hypothetical protein FIM10_12115 [Sphingomonadales bacterium 56]|uniref:hypothetical protein n=1 Tax=Sphingobium sp. S6 TaxID=2758386 RepID=UPI00191AA95D|nr:hypothetical protein [Sphingobium sp. S6]MBY2929418.1 hypothetical protein [Sphingomonadales bacterium 56]CAD7339426.1 hypothetical protein SPHS6_02449 [Sphingobium sp. S6]
MRDLVEQMYRDLLEREASPEDYIRMEKFLRRLPSEMKNSPGVLAEVIFRVEHVRQMNEVVQKATFETQQKIHRDLPGRVEKAAEMAFHAFRDLMPVDSRDAMARLYRWGAFWMLFVLIFGFITGGASTKWWLSRPEIRHHAISEINFNHCINAVFGAAAIKRRNDDNAAGHDAEQFRSDARICAAEYADRLTNQ